MSATSTTTQWILELADKVTSPMRKIARTSNATERSIDKVNDRIDQLKNKSGSFKNQIAKLGLGVSLAAALTSGGKGFIEFENSMAIANTMAQKSGKEYDLLNDKIKGIAQIVPVARDELANGLYETISAGVPENNWITFLQDSTKAAVAGQAEASTVIGATSTVIKNYAKDWSDALTIQDKFQRTVKLGQIPSLEALASSLPRVTAVAAKLNVTENELLGTFATASGAMGSTSEVATQLNATLSAMLKPSAEATEVANKLGIAFNADSITRAGGLQNYINELLPRIQAFSAKTGQNQEELIGKLFGSQEAIKFVIGMGGTLSQSWAENTKNITGATGDVENAFNTMANTTKAQMQLAKNSFNNAMDEIFISAQPVLLKMVQITSSVFKLVGGFMKANPTITKFITVGTILATTLGVAIIAFNYASLQLSLLRLNFTKMILTLKTSAVWTKIVTAAQWLWNAALTANPIGLVIAAVAALIGAMVYAYNKIGWFRGAIKATWEVLKGFATMLKNYVINRIKEMISGITGIGKTLMLFFSGEWKKAWETGKQAVKDLTGIGAASQNQLVKDMKATGKAAATAYNDGVNEVKKKSTADETAKTPKFSLSEQKPTENAGIAGLTDFAGNATGNQNPTPNNTNNNGLTGAGNNAGKRITMNLEIKNYFNIANNWRDEVDKIADAVTGKVNDRLRDAVMSV